jgi:hypothetical protein
VKPGNLATPDIATGHRPSPAPRPFRRPGFGGCSAKRVASRLLFTAFAKKSGGKSGFLTLVLTPFTNPNMYRRGKGTNHSLKHCKCGSCCTASANRRRGACKDNTRENGYKGIGLSAQLNHLSDCYIQKRFRKQVEGSAYGRSKRARGDLRFQKHRGTLYRY